jgi:hypothetical protein
MKFKAFKKYKRNKDIFTKEDDTLELRIEINDVKICIIEHQYGERVSSPWVDITTSTGISYGMDFSRFIEKIIS